VRRNSVIYASTASQVSRNQALNAEKRAKGRSPALQTSSPAASRLPAPPINRNQSKALLKKQPSLNDLNKSKTSNQKTAWAAGTKTALPNAPDKTK